MNYCMGLRIEMTYTACELYDHIKSFNKMKYCIGRNRNNFTMIDFPTDKLKYYTSKSYPYMMARFSIYNKYKCGETCCYLTGNTFECEVVDKAENGERMIVKSDIDPDVISILLFK